MSDDLIKIGDIEKFSIVDFPSKIAAVVFMQGCPWRCPFCYNKSLQNADSDGGAGWNNLLNLLAHRKGILDAVVFSGGEPLLQENLPQAMKEVKDLGFEIGLHTGGFAPERLAKVINMVSWVGLDIKAPLTEDSYRKATRGTTSVEKIKKSLQILLDSDIHFECRTTCDPRILTVDDICKIAEELSVLGVKEYYLQKYRPVADDKTTSDADCEKFFDDKLLQCLREKFAIFSVRK